MLESLSSNIDNKKSKFEIFRDDIELDCDAIKNIDRDFFMLYSLDDPFHNPDMLGLSRVEQAKNPNILCLATERGGHVSWISSDPTATFLGSVLKVCAS